MRLIHDVPASLVDRIGYDRPMLVAYAEEIVSNPDYLALYREALGDRKFVILSSLMQTGPGVLGPGVLEDLIEAAVKLRPSEVVLPNIPAHPEKSVRLTAESSSLLQSAGANSSPFMAVPHGADFREYMENVTRLSTFSQVKTIGVTADVFDKYHLTRRAFFQAMAKCPRTVHLLGLTDDLADLTDPLSKARFRSVSTPKAVVYGLSGTAVKLGLKKVPEYGGREQFGGPAGFMAFTTEETDKVEAANTNITNWDGS